MPHCALGSGDLLVGEGRKPELDNDLLVDSERSSTNLPLVPRRALERASAEARGSRRDGSRTRDQFTVSRLIRVAPTWGISLCQSFLPCSLDQPWNDLFP